MTLLFNFYYILVTRHILLQANNNFVNWQIWTSI
jgi:hypothetical protein